MSMEPYEAQRERKRFESQARGEEDIAGGEPAGAEFAEGDGVAFAFQPDGEIAELRFEVNFRDGGGFVDFQELEYAGGGEDSGRPSEGLAL